LPFIDHASGSNPQVHTFLATLATVKCLSDWWMYWLVDRRLVCRSLLLRSFVDKVYLRRIVWTADVQSQLTMWWKYRSRVAECCVGDWGNCPSTMSLMFPQLTSFFSDLKYGLTSSRRGSHPTAASRATTSSMDDELDDHPHDDSRPAPGYNCLGSRSASMECGLSAVGRKRRRRRFKKQPLCSAESLDRLSDRVYRYRSQQ